MLKLFFLLGLGVALIHSKPHGGRSKGPKLSADGPPDAPMTAADLKDELAQLQHTALTISEGIKTVKELAVKAISDPSMEGFNEFGQAFGEMLHHVGKQFGEETERVLGIYETIWESQHELEQDVQCGDVAALDKDKENNANLGMSWAVAMITDLGCIEEQFATAEHIPLDMITDDLHEDDALQILHGILKQMHHIKKTGDQFGNAMGSISSFLGLGDATGKDVKDHDDHDDDSFKSADLDDIDKRNLGKLLRFLKNYNKK